MSLPHAPLHLALLLFLCTEVSFPKCEFDPAQLHAQINKMKQGGVMPKHQSARMRRCSSRKGEKRVGDAVAVSILEKGKMQKKKTKGTKTANIALVVVHVAWLWDVVNHTALVYLMFLKRSAPRLPSSFSRSAISGIMGGGGPECFLLKVGVGGAASKTALDRLELESPVLIRRNQPLLLLDLRSSMKLEPLWLEGRAPLATVRLPFDCNWPST